MGKQKKILSDILDSFLLRYNPKQIRKAFKRSLNKYDIIRRILNDVVLSNDEIVQLLRIIFNKQK